MKKKLRTKKIKVPLFEGYNTGLQPINIIHLSTNTDATIIKKHSCNQSSN